MSEHMSPIPSRIYNAAVGGHVCGTDDIDFGQKVVHLIKYDRAGNEVSFESQVTQANKIYVIHDDFILSGNVSILANCTLQFEGGSISGAYTLTGNNTNINAGLVKIFGTDITLGGSWNVAVSYPEWFDVSDAVKTRNAIQKAVNIADHIVLSGDYNVQNSVYNPNEDMYAQRQLIIAGTVTEDYITVGSGKTIEITGKVKATSPLTDLFVVEGDCTVFRGGGIIEGCGIINDYNGAYHNHEAEWKQWKASLIKIYGNNNKIENLNICTPTSVGVYIGINTEGSAITVPSRNNNINNCTFSGGLSVHGGESSTYLMAIVSDGSGTVVENNRFVQDNNGKNIYSALFTSSQSSSLPYIFRNNYVEGVLEHAVYSYASGGIIDGNDIIDTEDIPLQIFGSETTITNNNIKTTKYTVSGTIAEKYGIVVSKSNNIIKGNNIKNYTKSSILITDAYNFQEGDSISNNIIEDNYIEHYFGASAEVSPITVECNNSYISNVLIGKNTIIGLNTSNNYSYLGAIFINGKANIIKDVSVYDNYIKNVTESGIFIASTNTSYTGKNVSIVGNKLIDVNNSSIGDQYQRKAISTDGINKVVISNNNILSSENKISNIEGFIQAASYDNIIITENTVVWLSRDADNIVELFGKIVLVLDDYKKAYITNNYFAGNTKGMFKIAPDASSIDLENVGSPVYGNPSKITKITPLNSAANELQNSGNYLYDTRADTVGYTARIRLETKQGQAVGGTDDCLFEWEIVYIGGII